MAIEPLLLGSVEIPRIPAFNSVAPQLLSGGKTIDATGEKVAVFCGMWPKSGEIDKIEWLTRTGTTTVTNSIRASIQGVNSSGNPNGTISVYRDVPGGSLTSGGWVVPGLMTDNGTDGGNKLTVTKSNHFAFVLEFTSFVAGNAYGIAMLDGKTYNGHYCNHYTTSWNKDENIPIFSILYADGTRSQMEGSIYPISALGSLALNTGTTPDEVGLKFSFPTDMLVGGGWFIADLDGSADMILYDEQYEIKRSDFMDKDARQVTTAYAHHGQFATNFRCRANENYVLAIKPTTATSLTVHYWEANAPEMMYATPSGNPWVWVERTDGGPWVERADRRPWEGMIITGVDHELAGSSGDGFPGYD